MSAGFIAACKKASRRAVLFFLMVTAAACGNPTASGGVPQASNEASQPLAAETEIPQLTPTPTEEAVSPLDKLLDPCAILPADEIEDLLGFFPIFADGRRSFMTPTLTQGWVADHEPETERVLYDCFYGTFDKFEQEQEITFSVEVFSDPADAQAQMEVFHEFYDQRLLQAEVPPRLPMVEISDLGDQAYSFVPQITTDPKTGLPLVATLGNYPIVYFLSGNYLVSINILAPPPTNEDNQTYFAKALEIARNALTALPTDIHSAMAEQYYELDSSGQPAGKPIEPCELLTRDEAQQYMDESISIEESWSNYRGFPESWQSSCAYGSFQTIKIYVELLSDGQLEYSINEYESQGILEISDIGERAFRGDPWNMNTDITVFMGHSYVQIYISNSSDEEAQFQSAFELAQLVLSRLPKIE